MPDDDSFTVDLDASSNSVKISGTLANRDVYRTFDDLNEDRRNNFGLRAFKVGVIALRDAEAVSKLDYVEKEFDRMRSDFEQQMEKMFGDDGRLVAKMQEVFGEDGKMERKLQEFFGDDGRFERVVDEFLGEDGKLEKAVHDAVGEDGAFQETMDDFLGEKGRLREELDREFGEDSGRLWRLLDPEKETTVLGRFRKQIEDQFDPTKEGSALYELRENIDRQFQEIKTGLGIEEAVAEERAKGTQKGFDFEDIVVDLVEQVAAPFGDKVEHVGKESGPLGDVGDVLSEMNTDETGAAERRIVVEVKNRGVTLKGKDSIYKELDDAMQNRDAQFGIAAVVAENAERFAPLRYTAPNYILVSVEKDLGESLELDVAYRLARSLVLSRLARGEVTLNVETIQAHVQSIRSQLENIRAMKRGLTSAATEIEGVKGSLDNMRDAIRDDLDSLESKLRAGSEEE